MPFFMSYSAIFICVLKIYYDQYIILMVILFKLDELFGSQQKYHIVTSAG
jgi:hypothetical protein